MSAAPRMALLAAVLVATAAIPARPETLGGLALLALAALSANRQGWRALRERWRPIATFAMACGLIALLNREAMWTPLTLWARCTITVLWATALTAGLTHADVLDGLTSLRLPPRLVALCYLMADAIRLTRDEVRRVVRARDLRGKPRGLRAIRAAGSVAAALMIRLALRAETRALALSSRGFHGRLPLYARASRRPAQRPAAPSQSAR